MKNRIVILLVVLVWSLGAGSALAVSEPQLDAIRSLGELNGLALSCGRIQETRRMKQAMVANLPKQKVLGDLFDQETNRAFLAFTKGEQVCPGEADLSGRVSRAIGVLEQVFPRK